MIATTNTVIEIIFEQFIKIHLQFHPGFLLKAIGDVSITTRLLHFFAKMSFREIFFVLIVSFFQIKS